MHPTVKVAVFVLVRLVEVRVNDVLVKVLVEVEVTEVLVSVLLVVVDDIRVSVVDVSVNVVVELWIHMSWGGKKNRR